MSGHHVSRCIIMHLNLYFHTVNISVPTILKLDILFWQHKNCQGAIPKRFSFSIQKSTRFITSLILLTLIATAYSDFLCHGGGVDSTPPIENHLRVVFVQFFLIPAKVIYNCRSHAKGNSQKFKIERIEKL